MISKNKTKKGTAREGSEREKPFERGGKGERGKEPTRVNLGDYEPTPGFSTSALAFLPAYFHVHSKDNS